MCRINYVSKGYVLRTETEPSDPSSRASRTKKGYAPGVSSPFDPKDSTEPVLKNFQDQTIRMHIAEVGMYMFS